MLTCQYLLKCTEFFHRFQKLRTCFKVQAKQVLKIRVLSHGSCGVLLLWKRKDSNDLKGDRQDKLILAAPLTVLKTLISELQELAGPEPS